MTTATAIISSKGQITLPAGLRRSIGIDFGSRVKISKKSNQIIIEPDDYEEKLNDLRKKLKAAVIANGTWGMSWEKVKANSDAAREAYYKEKYGV
jgi:AbrB family looped-hinge helix DNA binding protein